MAGHEIGFAVDESYALPDLSRLPGVEVTVEAERRLAATCYDAPDLRLAAWGITLGHSPGEAAGASWTLELPLGDGSRVLSRHEVHFAGPPGEPPEAAVDALSAVLRGSRVAPLATLSTVRRRWALRAVDGGPVAVVDDDRVAARGDGVRVRRFREIGLAPAEGAPAALLREATQRIEAAGARPQAPVPRLLRTLDADLAGGPEPRVPPLGRDATVAEVLRAVVALSARRLIGHDPGVRLDLHPEAVHEARVAARQLRSQLAALAGFLDAQWAEETRSGLRWLGRGLGGVRDHDVLAARLSAQAAGLAEEDREDAERLLAGLGEERARLRASLLRQLRSPRYLALLEGLVAAAGEPPVRDGDAKARAVLPAVGWRAWHRLARAVGAAALNPAADRLHRVRILAKRARYVAEAVALLGGHAAMRLAHALADLQGTLGDLQDAIVAEAWLRRRARRGTLAQAVAAGQLIAAQRAAAEESRSAWRHAWERAAARRPQRWTKARGEAS